MLTAPDGKTPMPQVLWPRHCVQKTWGAECHPDLVVDASDPDRLGAPTKTWNLAGLHCAYAATPEPRHETVKISWRKFQYALQYRCTNGLWFSRG